MENERSRAFSSDCKLNATEVSSTHTSREVFEKNGNILLKNNKRRGRRPKRTEQISEPNGNVISHCNPNVTNADDNSTKYGLKLFPIFSKASNLRTEFNLLEQKSTEVSSQKTESTKVESLLEEASTDDHILGEKDQVILSETGAGNKKVTPQKGKRKRSDKNDKVGLDSQNYALGSEESTLEGIAPKQVIPESSTNDSKIISLESINASSEKNYKFFPIFTSPKPVSLVSKSEIAASTSSDEKPKKRGRKPGFKLLNRSETIKSDITVPSSGNTPKKRGRKPGSSSFTNRETVLSTKPNIENEPKKRGRKPGSSSLLKETKAEIISEAELPDDTVIKSEITKRKRQKIVQHESEDNLIDDVSVLSMESLSDCSITSHLPKNKSGLSVAKALTNMINKTHKKKKERKSQNLSPIELVENTSVPLDFITSTSLKPHKMSILTKPDDYSSNLSLNSTPIKAVHTTEIVVNEFPISVNPVTSFPGKSLLSNIPIDDLDLQLASKKKSNSLPLFPNPKSKKRPKISETIEVSVRRTSSRLQNKSFCYVNDSSNSSHASIISPCKNLEIDESGTNDKCLTRKPTNKLKSERLKVLPPNHEVLKNINLDKDIKLFPLFTQFQGTVSTNNGVGKVNSNTKEKLEDKQDKRSISKSSSTRNSVPNTLSGENSNPEIVVAEEVKDKKGNKVQLNSKIASCEDSNDSVQELKVGQTKNQSKVSIDKLSLKSDNCKITQEATGKIVAVKQSSTFLRHLESYLTFPLQSHCSPAVDTLESNALKHFILKEQETETDVKIPMWNGIIGITEVKSLEVMNDSKSLREDISINSSKHTNGKSVKNDDLLWTDIASDYNLKEVVSESTICELNLWLKQWKSKFTKHVKSRQSDKTDSLDSFSGDSSDSDIDGDSNSIIIMGPPGSGKTSLVFSLANEHGFKVLEVNASSCRNGRNISHQLKEALESYHVENTKVADIDFTRQSNEKGSAKDFKEVKNNKPAKKNILSFLRTEKNDIKGSKKNASEKEFFQVKSKTFSNSSIQDQKGRKSARKMRDQSNLESFKKSGETKKDSSLCTISSQTIILFDDIDVVFEEDEGLWSTIRGFLRISKKPVIFTASRNLEIVRANLDFDIRVLHLKPMIADFAIRKINSQCKKYNRQSPNVNNKMMVHYHSNDLRRSLLHTQFWSQSVSNQRIDLPINFENHLSVNTLLLGSSDFCVTDFIPLIFKRTSDCFSRVISQYHQIGYDVLHSNLFPIFNITSAVEGREMWEVANKLAVDTVPVTDSADDDSSAISQATKKNIKSDLWQEACKIFELKKKSLQNGSCSTDLSIFFDILENFSFIDCVKGISSRYRDWISIPERIKKWNLGLPMCNDYGFKVYNDFAVDMISIMQILSLHVAKTKPLKCKLVKFENEALILEHPFMDIFNFSTESKIDCIASALPTSLYLNKTALNLDYLSTLKLICREESLKQSNSGKRSNRFLHYFDSISLLIDKYQIEQIMNGFDKS